MVGVIYAVGGQTKSGNSLSTVEVYNPTRYASFFKIFKIFILIQAFKPITLRLNYKSPDLAEFLYKFQRR
jgi:hypothetical protein